MSGLIRTLVLGVLALFLGVVGVLLTSPDGAIFDTSAQPKSPSDSSIFEGQGNLTFGCALWEPLTIKAYDEATRDIRPLEDFYLSATNSEAVLAVARHDGIVIVSGLRCGISVDWRRFPREGN